MSPNCRPGNSSMHVFSLFMAFLVRALHMCTKVPPPSPNLIRNPLTLSSRSKGRGPKVPRVTWGLIQYHDDISNALYFLMDQSTYSLQCCENLCRITVICIACVYASLCEAGSANIQMECKHIVVYYDAAYTKYVRNTMQNNAN